jgi:ribokinase
MSPSRALFAGDISFDTTVLVDHVPEPDEKVLTSEFVEDVGGVASNAAAACQLAGVPATLLCALGTDPAALACRASLAGRGVGVLHHDVPGSTTRALITLERHGEKRLVLATGVSMYPSLEQCRTVPLDGIGWMHTAVYDRDAATELVRRCRRAGLPWSLDLEPATLSGGLAPLTDALRDAEVVFVNAHAAAALRPDPERALFAAGVRAVVRTEGAGGAHWCTHTERLAVPVPAGSPAGVDSTGAGDCLAGTFVARRLLGDRPLPALRYAVAAASYSVGRLGGQSSYAGRAELETWTVEEGATTA